MVSAPRTIRFGISDDLFRYLGRAVSVPLCARACARVRARVCASARACARGPRAARARRRHQRQRAFGARASDVIVSQRAAPGNPRRLPGAPLFGDGPGARGQLTPKMHVKRSAVFSPDVRGLSPRVKNRPLNESWVRSGQIVDRGSSRGDEHSPGGQRGTESNI